MPKGYAGKILRIDLTEKSIKRETLPDSFYRMYLGGGGFGTYFLLQETDADTDPLGPDNIITVAPGLTTGPAVSGVSRCSVTALSPETGAVGDSQAGGNLGPFIKRSGFDGIVIRGRSESPCYIYIDNENVEIRDASAYTGMTVLDARDRFVNDLENSKISVLQCGPAGEKLVSFANLASDLNNYFGRTGMGAVFGSKNLRAVVVSGTGSIDFADSEALKKLARTGASRVTGSGFVSLIKKHGTPGLVKGNAESGNLCTHNYSRGFHRDYMNVDGTAIEGTIASGGTTCYGCVVGCRKTVKSESPLKVTDRLGGPEFETIGVMGSNLDILDPVVISKANELCNNYGMDTITLGGITAYLFDCAEKGLVDPDKMNLGSLRYGDGESLIKIVEASAAREGYGHIVAGGFENCINTFGESTKERAVCVKNHGFAVHMTQVKPAMALMYAVSPIGADHMSCEHDWLISDTSDAARGLGILTPGDPASTDSDKVRMVVYSQYYYSVLDSLGLCMFCWGAGSLFTYPELEELVYSVSGLGMSFWELMKAGERRINMMRQLNLKRGFTASDDDLPSMLSEEIPEGPSSGRKVDRASFESMKSAYYSMMGWDSGGVPGEPKLTELGLDWTV